MARKWIFGLLPLLLLSVLLVYFFALGPLGVFRAAFPPVEEISIDRIVLPEENRIVVHVTNAGPDSVTLAQVLVDDAFWHYRTEPEEKEIPRLGRSKIYLSYPWVEGETHEVTLITSTGLTFTGEIPVATRSPQANWTYFWTFSMLGLYAGVIPVLLGLLWYPFLRDISPRWLFFFLSLTAGLLLFLAMDTLEEALEIAERVPGPYQGQALIFIGALTALLSLMYLSRSKGSRADKSTQEGRFWTALMIALGIGLHNLGEGLAIGSAYALGEISLGTFLVVGFTLHNLTEGLGIVAPIARDRPAIGNLVLLGLLAGVPTIPGAWIGGFAYSALWSVLFLGVGLGAILQVIMELSQMIVRQKEGRLVSAHNVSGFLAGLFIMYVTGLFVVT